MRARSYPPVIAMCLLAVLVAVGCDDDGGGTTLTDATVSDTNSTADATTTSAGDTGSTTPDASDNEITSGDLADDTSESDATTADVTGTDSTDAIATDAAVDATLDDASSTDTSTTDATTTPDASMDMGVDMDATTMPVLDPTMSGPYTTTVVTDSVMVSATGNTVDIRAVHPTSGPTMGPYPVVLFGHGFQLPPSQYDSYLDHFASHGYVAISVDFVAEFDGSSTSAGQVAELLTGVDWASGALAGVADVQTVATIGHSLGGALSVLAAAGDPRVKAVVGLDPIDTTDTDVSALAPAVPTLYLGQTLDTMPVVGMMACSPADRNYQTFYASATSPSVEVTVDGAAHNSWLDDRFSCLICLVCQQPTASDADVRALSVAMATAFFGLHLRGESGYESWLTGSDAQATWVTPGAVTIVSK